MSRSRLILLSSSLAALLSCTAPTSEPTPGSGGAGGSSSGTAGTTGSAGNPGSGGSSSGSAGNTGSGGSSSGTAGNTGSGGSSSGTAGNSSGSAGNPGSGGSSSGSAGSTGGTTSRGGTTGSAGSAAGSSGSAGSTGGTTSRGGTTGSAGSTAGTGGATGSAGTGGSAIKMDMGGKLLAKAGDVAMNTKDYLNLGDMRLINNRWGSDALNCTGSVQRVYLTGDSPPLIGWDFNRPACGGSRGDPDFPEVEFGVAPFGRTSSNLTTPAFSSTTLLPIQINSTSLQSASVTLNNFVVTIQSADPPSFWDSTVEFWISKQDPRTNDNAGVYAEIIAFIGWNSQRLNSSQGGWACDKSGGVSAGANQYTLCHQSDTWSNGQWRFFNFNVNGGPMKTFNGKVDVKAMLDWVRNNYSGFTNDMWLTRIEVGTEIDDSTKGSVRATNMTFEVNGQTRSMEHQ